MDATTVGEALRSLTGANPELERELLHPDGTLRRSFAVLLNGVDVRNLERERTPLRAGDSISLIPSLSGG
ncbi:MAG: MoaD/ThiS family protein [Thermoplasmata archaeon]|nr:MoaD/ThiS family protein [Thermoplasmata archaeon]